jgi:hypothetical protein
MVIAAPLADHVALSGEPAFTCYYSNVSGYRIQ